jgi:hypothetical protein
MKSRMIGTAGALVASAFLTNPASAAPILCETLTNNHMYVGSAYVSSCVDAGIGNVNGNPKTDDFLIDNPGLDYTGIGDASFYQDSANPEFGTFDLSSALWDTWSSIAIGFKFGTGNKPDQWFVYLLNSDVTHGAWEFVNVFGKGGGLSHVQLYGVEGGTTQVPEPASLALLSIGALGLAFARRRRNS